MGVGGPSFSLKHVGSDGDLGGKCQAKGELMGLGHHSFCSTPSGGHRGQNPPPRAELAKQWLCVDRWMWVIGLPPTHHLLSSRRLGGSWEDIILEGLRKYEQGAC